jgi:hypothetical protein
MKITLESDAAVRDEAIQVLMKHLPPSKVARILAAWKIGEGDYVIERDRMFTGETLDSLFAEIKDRQKAAESKEG